MCDRLGISVWEVIDTAATKPFGFLPHYPGPGLGGDCIPVVPHFLAWRLREYGYSAQLIDAAHEINAQMPVYVVQKMVRAVFGNNNVDTCARVCHSPTGYGLKQTFGESAGTQDFSSVDEADVILVIGANPTDAHPVFGSCAPRGLTSEHSASLGVITRCVARRARKRVAHAGP